MFHDVFGHIPLLTHEPYAEFMHEFGKLGVKYSKNQEVVKMLRCLYWYTIEFGLVGSDEERKVYGAGIISSHKETDLACGPEFSTTCLQS